ncbi:MAG TPA: hypothetical protein VFI47_05790 [Acidimicrobiales bacterium]|nr:hypothetical protein [Acidimicrobiales bacterium]
MGHVHLASQAHEAPGEATASPGASPLLDIGDDVGALVVYLDRTTRSGELEACPAGRPADRFHTGVHPRAVGGRDVPVAVFPQVVRGSYQVLDDEGIPMALVHVSGGRVAEIDLRTGH